MVYGLSNMSGLRVGRRYVVTSEIVLARHRGRWPGPITSVVLVRHVRLVMVDESISPTCRVCFWAAA